MRVLISGSTGLIGSALAASLRDSGLETAGLVRPGPAATGANVQWDPAAGTIDADALAGFGAVIHLAGESISGRWTRAKMDRISDSRVQGTQTLCKALAALPASARPAVMVSASAIGYYGDRGDEMLAEDAGIGNMFLSGVCKQWEAATAPAAGAGIRVACTRFGVVLSARGGALREMLTPFRMGLGGRIGSGRQYISWIALADAVAAIRWILDHAALAGPVNVASPNPVTNAEFAAALGRALHRPALLPTPAFAVRLAFGKMADELLLASARVVPRKLLDSGFQFRYPNLPEALCAALDEKRSAPSSP
jgi:hypothetical protein